MIAFFCSSLQPEPSCLLVSRSRHELLPLPSQHESLPARSPPCPWRSLLQSEWHMPTLARSQLVSRNSGVLSARARRQYRRDFFSTRRACSFRSRKRPSPEAKPTREQRGLPAHPCPPA